MHSSVEDVITKPWFLHAFLPLQLLLAPLQELWPLQLLPPIHLTAAWLEPLDDLREYGASQEHSPHRCCQNGTR